MSSLTCYTKFKYKTHVTYTEMLTENYQLQIGRIHCLAYNTWQMGAASNGVNGWQIGQMYSHPK